MNPNSTSNNGIDVTALSFEEALEAIRRALSARYPGCGLMYVSYSNSSDGNRVSSCGIFGDQTQIECAGTDLVHRNKHVSDFCHAVFCNQMISLPSSSLSYTEKALHDAVLDYGKYRGIDVNGIPYYTRHEATPQLATPNPQLNTTEGIAARIKMLNDEVKSLMRNLDPNVQAQTLKALAKRLRRAGDITGAIAKEAEAEAILLKVQQQAQLKIRRQSAAAHARQCKAQRRAQRIQADIDRQRSKQQFNPHAAAKAKMRKIRERQAERAASKKKASQSREWTNRPISQVIAQRAI